jgi:hypothetical protein
MTLPVDAYLPSGHDLLQTTRAMAALEQSCLSRYGLRFVPNTSDLPDFGKNSRRYGVPESLEVARTHGFHMTKNDPRSLPDHLATPPSQDVRTVLTGRSARGGVVHTYHGVSVPKGGCVAEADHTISGGDGTERAGHASAAEEIRAHSFEYSQLDPRVIAAQTAWKKCMGNQGYTAYKTTFDALGDDRWDAPAATSQEISVAVADWTCAKNVNLVGTWYAVESAYQNSQIETHAEELQQEREDLRQQAKRVATALAGGTVSRTGADSDS